MKRHVIFHVDVNSAFLSWSAVHHLQMGGKEDLRLIPSVVGGDPEKRHGVVLAKSVPASKYGVKTGESLYSALKKCPGLKVVSPKSGIYTKASRAMYALLNEYSDNMEKYSIDESFMAMGQMEMEDALETAREISDRTLEELGFTVNIGISTVKLLAKMASDFKKPKGIHTLYPEEIEEKMWSLPVNDLFMVGPKMAEKLKDLNIMTIGKLAHTDPVFLKDRFMSYGMMLHAFANGRDTSGVHSEGRGETKGVGNSTTLSRDVSDLRTLDITLLSLLETLIPRLKALDKKALTVKVHYTTPEFKVKSRQRTLKEPTDSFKTVYKVSREVLRELWDGKPIRKLGIGVTNLTECTAEQLTMFDYKDKLKNEKVEDTILKIREKFGDDSLIRASFISSDTESHRGGTENGGFSE